MVKLIAVLIVVWMSTGPARAWSLKESLGLQQAREANAKAIAATRPYKRYRRHRVRHHRVKPPRISKPRSAFAAVHREDPEDVADEAMPDRLRLDTAINDLSLEADNERLYSAMRWKMDQAFWDRMLLKNVSLANGGPVIWEPAPAPMKFEFPLKWLVVAGVVLAAGGSVVYAVRGK